MPLRHLGLQFPPDPVLTRRIKGLLRDGSYERKEAQALRRLISPGDRVLELGGGLGFLSARAHRLGASAVTVVEANPELVGYIARQHAANDIRDAKVLHGLAAPSPGPDRDFHLRRNFLASSGDADTGAAIRTVQVPQLPIADLLDGARPDILICDIEGAEREVLPAADLSGLRAAIVELHPQWIGATGVAAVFDAFARAGLTYAAKGSEGKVVVFERIPAPQAA